MRLNTVNDIHEPNSMSARRRGRFEAGFTDALTPPTYCEQYLISDHYKGVPLAKYHREYLKTQSEENKQQETS